MKTGDTLRAGSKVEVKKVGTQGWTDYVTKRDVVVTANVREVLFKVGRSIHNVKKFWVFTVKGYEIRIRKDS